MDTWWQTETGGFMITPLPITPLKPGSATKPFPGILADVVDLEGNPVGDNQGGYLVIKHPWPSMMRTVYGDDNRFRRTYWEHIPPKDGKYLYFTGKSLKSRAGTKPATRPALMRMATCGSSAGSMT